MKWQFCARHDDPVEMPGFHMSVWDMDRSPLDADWSPDGRAEYGAHVEFSGLHDSGASPGKYYSHGFAHGDIAQANGATRSLVVSDKDASTRSTTDDKSVVVVTGPDVRGGRDDFKHSWLHTHHTVESYPSKVDSAPVSVPMPDLSSGMRNITAQQQSAMFSVTTATATTSTPTRVLAKDKTKTVSAGDDYVLPGQSAPVVPAASSTSRAAASYR